MEEEVFRLCLNKTGGYIHLIEEGFKKWLREVYLVEWTSTPPNQDI